VCKEEFQVFFKCFVVPLCVRALEKRLQDEEAITPTPRYQGRWKQHSLKEVIQQVKTALDDAYRGLELGFWSERKNLSKEAYIPTLECPFFISMDNGPAHSFFQGRGCSRHTREPGCSLLQVIYVAPHGHDIHQVVERTIGVIKISFFSF
jgi:hypothetical protein